MDRSRHCRSSRSMLVRCWIGPERARASSRAEPAESRTDLAATPTYQYTGTTQYSVNAVLIRYALLGLGSSARSLDRDGPIFVPGAGPDDAGEPDISSMFARPCLALASSGLFRTDPSSSFAFLSAAWRARVNESTIRSGAACCDHSITRLREIPRTLGQRVSALEGKTLRCDPTRRRRCKPSEHGSFRSLFVIAKLYRGRAVVQRKLNGDYSATW